MTAAVLRGPGQPFEVTSLVLDRPRRDEAVIEIAGSGLCHTDLAVRDGLYPVPFPIVLGHEGSGRVVEVGDDVERVQPGDHVVASFSWCGACASCAAGHPAYCADGFSRNFGGCRADGSTTLTASRPVASPFFGQSSFAQAAVVPAANVVPVSRSLPIELLGPLGCGFQTGAGAVLNVLRLGPGSSLAVFGTGAVGLAATMAAAASGVTTIVGIDRSPGRLALGKSLGLSETLPAGAEMVEQIREITAGGVTAAIDTTGVPAVLRAAVDSLRPGGSCVVLGAAPLGTEVRLDMGELLFGRSVAGVIEGDAVPGVTIPALIDLWQAGRFAFDRLVETFPLADIAQVAAASLAGEVVKPVLVP